MARYGLIWLKLVNICNIAEHIEYICEHALHVWKFKESLLLKCRGARSIQSGRNGCARVCSGTKRG